MHLHKISLSLPACLTDAQAGFVSEALADLSQARSALRKNNDHEEPWDLEWLVEDAPDRAGLEARLALACELHGITLDPAPVWQIEPVPERDWLAYSYKQFPPFSVGPFFIYGAHDAGKTPDGQIGLQIDAATAFGSGEHGTTKGCLQAMLDLKGRGDCPWNVLDMGTGSGILAIAAWRLWKSPVLAVDNDEEAVRVADRHRIANHVPTGATEMRCVCGDGFQTPEVQSQKPFDLIIANILAGPLSDMAPDLAAVVDENGAVILSGILSEQAQKVQTAYEAQGLALRKTVEIGDWTTLVMRRV